MGISTKYKLRIVGVTTLALGAVVNANAWLITFSGTNAGNLLTKTNGFQTLFTAAPFNATVFPIGAALASGSATFTSGAQLLTVDFTQTNQAVMGGTISTSGTWKLAGAFGVKVAPTGTYSASLDNLFTKGDFAMAFVGTVPEPTPFAILGLGLVGLCARRRKRS